MGCDKALLRFRGGTLVGEVCRAVEEAAGCVTLVGHRQPPPVRAIPDLYPGEGPLGGILTALHDSHADWNLIVACDMPGVHFHFLRRLLTLADASAAQAIMPCGPLAQPQPLCAVYHRSARGAIQTVFNGGVRAVHEAISRLIVQLVPVADAEVLQNVNTPEDWAAYDAK
jgi:molybdopterin-guanine dinucleotide biosynthesis protein A